MRWKRTVAAATAAVALVVAGCGGESSGTSDDGGGSSTGGGSTAQVAQGGALTVAHTDGIPQLNPVIRTFAWRRCCSR